MGKIEVNPLEAARQATNLLQAADRLSLRKSVDFSTHTTIQGNQQAKSSTQKLQQAMNQTHQLLQRDIQLIQSAVSSFKRTDEQAKKLVEFPLSGK